MNLTAVIDFETTGISPTCGDRATEVAIVLLEDNQVVDRFQSLMNAGVRIPSFITQLTGITNAMVAAAPDAAQVISDASRFVGAAPLVAGRAHRALADAEMAAGLLVQIQHDLHTCHRVARPDHALLMALQRCAKAAVGLLMARHADA